MPLEKRAVKLTDIEGLYPNIDARRIEQPHILKGRNFIWSFDGPYSGLGYGLLSADSDEDVKLGAAEYIQYIDLEGLLLVLCSTGVYEYDPVARTYTQLHALTATQFTKMYKWTYARVGLFYYISHPGLNVPDADTGTILKIDISDKTITEITDSVPVGAMALTSSRGRLIVLGDNQYSWSGLDDGSNLTPSLVTGAGAQGLSIIGGTPYTLERTANGFFVFTSEGILIARYYQGPGVFIHRVLQDDIWLVNHLCAVNIGCLLYTSPSPRDRQKSRMPSSA